MIRDDLDDVENGAVAQGAAEQQAAAQEDHADAQPKGEPPEDAGADAQPKAEDDRSAVPSDTEQQPDGVHGFEGGKPSDGSTEGDDDEPVAEPPRACRVYLDLSFMIPPGATQIGDEMMVADDDSTRAFIEIEGEGPDVVVSFEDIWDEHHGTRRVISWK